MYARIETHPNIAYGVSIVMKYCSNPTRGHKKVVKRIIEYLKGTGYYGIEFNGDLDDLHVLEGY